MFRVVFENSTFNKFHSESYSVLSPFLSKLRYAYHRNRKNMFYLLVQFKIESEIALKSYKQYLFVLSPKIHCLFVLQCSKSIIHQTKWCTCICHMTWPISCPTLKHYCFTLLFQSNNVQTPR